MIKRTVMFFAAASLMGLGALAATRAQAAPLQGEKEEQGEKGEKSESSAWKKPPTPSAKVGPIQAIAAAKAKVGGGTAFSANFEFDEGHWVYGVMIVKGHQLFEVEVDPKSGKALDSEEINPSGEANEVKSELTKIAAAGG